MKIPRLSSEGRPACALRHQHCRTGALNALWARPPPFSPRGSCFWSQVRAEPLDKAGLLGPSAAAAAAKGAKPAKYATVYPMIGTPPALLAVPTHFFKARLLPAFPLPPLAPWLLPPTPPPFGHTARARRPAAVRARWCWRRGAASRWWARS